MAVSRNTCSDPVDRHVDNNVMNQLSAARHWESLDNPWVPKDADVDAEGADYVYVDLSLNPERYTGYKGEDARRIWAAIYEQSAFEGLSSKKKNSGELMSKGQQDSKGLGEPSADDAPAGGQILKGGALGQQHEVLYRLISGMHTSITLSIIQNFYNETSGKLLTPQILSAVQVVS